LTAGRAKLIGYARFSTRQQSTDRQQADLLAADARRDGPFVDHGVSGARAPQPQFERALDALVEGVTLGVTTLDRHDAPPRTRLPSPTHSGRALPPTGS